MFLDPATPNAPPEKKEKKEEEMANGRYLPIATVEHRSPDRVPWQLNDLDIPHHFRVFSSISESATRN